MPPKADYWKHFNVVVVVAYCLIAECQQPNAAAVGRPLSVMGGEPLFSVIKKSVENWLKNSVF